MGTRFDCYIGRGATAEWIGSGNFDGDPAGTPRDYGFEKATTEADFRKAVERFLATEEWATRPEQGWPWSWKDSGMTDYAYMWDGEQVLVSSFGHLAIPLATHSPDAEEATEEGGEVEVFPDMTDKKNVTLGRRSGLIVIVLSVPRTSDE